MNKTLTLIEQLLSETLLKPQKENIVPTKLEKNIKHYQINKKQILAHKAQSYKTSKQKKETLKEELISFLNTLPIEVITTTKKHMVLELKGYTFEINIKTK